MLFRVALAISIVSQASYAMVASAQVSETKLVASDGNEDDRFGWAVSAGGDRIVVGAQSDDQLADDAGAAYVYRRDGSAWIEEGKLTASGGSESDRFGLDAFINGERLIVGAAYEDLSIEKEDAGAAYVYWFDGAAWVEEARLTASDSEKDDQFGSTVAIRDSVAVVGSTWDDNYTGGVYVYRYDGTAWSETAKLTASDGSEGQRFGGRVHLGEDQLIVGARFDGDLGAGAGAAYVFHYDGSAWIEEAKLVADDGAPRDLFGSDVAMDESVAVIGASGSISGIGVGAGAAYIFRHNGSSWIQEAKLLPSDTAPAMVFGNTVAIEGDRVVIGAAADDDGATNAGSAYVFQYDSANWSQETKLTASDRSLGDAFASSVALDDDWVIVGAPNVDRDVEAGVGAVYLYELPPLNPLSADDTHPSRRAELRAPFPNPFSAQTVLTVDLAEAAKVSLEVYDVVGRRVARVGEARNQPGVTRISWDGRDAAGVPVPSGTYFLRLVIDGLTERHVETGKVVVVR